MKNNEFTYRYENRTEHTSRLHMYRSFDDSGFYPSYMHFHTEYEFILVRTGHIRVVNLHTDFHMYAPCILIHKPHSYHVVQGESDLPYERYITYFSEDDLELLKPVLTDIAPFAGNNDLCVYSIATEDVEDWVSLIKLFPHDRIPESIRLLFMGLLLEKLTELSPIDTAETPHRKSYINEVLRYIDSHITEALSIDILCDHFYISRSKLTRDFREYTKCSVHEYILSRRLLLACKLLKKGKNVSQTALECGFSNVSSFIRLFSVRFNITPLQYAKIALHNDK